MSFEESWGTTHWENWILGFILAVSEVNAYLCRSYFAGTVDETLFEFSKNYVLILSTIKSWGFKQQELLAGLVLLLHISSWRCCHTPNFLVGHGYMATHKNTNRKCVFAGTAEWGQGLYAPTQKMCLDVFHASQHVVWKKLWHLRIMMDFSFL